MKKGVKSQAAVFVILAIIIGVIVVFLGYNYFSERISESDRKYFEGLEVKPLFEQVREEVLGCREILAKGALDTIGFQGGYFTEKIRREDVEPIDGEFDGELFVPYYYYEGEILMPSKEKIEEELSDYVDYYLDWCIDDINVTDFKIRHGKSKTVAFIEDGEVVFESVMKVSIEREGHKTEINFKERPVKAKSALKDILEIAEFITESHREDPELYCINCVADMAEERNLYVNFAPANDLVSVVTITENYIDEEPYSFMFLNKYTGKEESPEVDLGEGEITGEGEKG